MVKKIVVSLILITLLISCESEQAKNQRLSQLTCEDSREGRSQDELRAIGDACFRRGNFVKSSGKEW